MTLWWTLPPGELIPFLTVVLLSLLFARWLWKMGDVWTWGEEKDKNCKSAHPQSSNDDAPHEMVRLK